MKREEADGARTIEAAIIAYRDCETMLRLLVANPRSQPPEDFKYVWPIIAQNLTKVADTIAAKAKGLEAMLINSVDPEGRA
jgi:hypothetical protein